MNERLKKPEFDCHTIATAYACGCDEEDKEVDKKAAVEKLKKELAELESEDKEAKKKKLEKMLDDLKEEEEGLEGDKKEGVEEKARKAGLEVENAG